MKKQQQLSPEEFALRAIEKLAADGRKAIHTVYSGFNQGFRKYFPGSDPVATVNELVEQGKLSSRLCKGGALIAKPGVLKKNADSPEATLKKMGL